MALQLETTAGHYGVTINDLKSIFPEKQKMFEMYLKLKDIVENKGKKEMLGQLADIDEDMVAFLRQSKNEQKITAYVKEHGTAVAEPVEPESEKKEIIRYKVEQIKKDGSTTSKTFADADKATDKYEELVTKNVSTRLYKIKITDGKEEILDTLGIFNAKGKKEIIVVEETEPIEPDAVIEDVSLEEIAEEQGKEPVGTMFNLAQFGEPYKFLKFLCLFNASAAWRTDSAGYFYWEVNGTNKTNYFVTSQNLLLQESYDKDVLASTLWFISPNPDRRTEVEVFLRNYLSGLGEVENEYDRSRLEIENSKAEVDDHFPEPVSKIPYGAVDYAIAKMYHFNTMSDLMTLFAITKIADENTQLDASELKELVLQYTEEKVQVSINSTQNLILKADTLDFLQEKGFLDDDLQLTDLAKNIIKLHEYCFDYNIHPFHKITYDVTDLYPDYQRLRSVVYEDTALYLREGNNVLEMGSGHVPMNEFRDDSVTNPALNKAIQKSFSDRQIVEYTPFSFCLGIDYRKYDVEGAVEAKINVSRDLGYFVFHNNINGTEIYVRSLELNYILTYYEGKKIFYSDIDGKSEWMIVKVQQENTEIVIALIGCPKKDTLGSIINFTTRPFNKARIIEEAKKINPVFQTAASYGSFAELSEGIIVEKTMEAVKEEVEQAQEEKKETDEGIREEIIEAPPVITEEEKEQGAVELPEEVIAQEIEKEEEAAPVIEEEVLEPETEPVSEVEKAKQEEEELVQYILVSNTLTIPIVAQLTEKGIKHRLEEEGTDETKIYHAEKDAEQVWLAREEAEAQERESKKKKVPSISADEAITELQHDVEILKKVKDAPKKAQKIRDKASDYKSQGLIGEDTYDEIMTAVDEIIAQRGVKITPKVEKEPEKKVKPVIIPTSKTVVKKAAKKPEQKKQEPEAKLPKGIKLPSEQFRISKVYDKVFLNTKNLSGKKKDIAIVEGLLAEDKDEVMLEDMVAIGFNIEKYAISDILLVVGDYQIYKPNYISQTWVISK